MRLEKFTGSLLGLAIGDSLGAKREGYLSFIKETDIGPRYTDDTAMMIGIAESLIECKGFNGDNMAQKFVKNYYKEPWRGYGLGPPKIFKMLKEGRKWNEFLDKEIYPEGSYGNGAAMRIAPIGLFYFDDEKMLRDISYKSSQITHSHSLSMEGAALEAYAVSLALIGKRDLIQKLYDFTTLDIYKNKVKTIERFLPEKRNRKKIVYELGNGVAAHESVPTAIFSFLATDSLKDSLNYAVSLGGDTDTIGAMTGAISGAYYGSDSIPPEWLEKLENKDYIDLLATSLYKIKTQSNSKKCE